jgi:hypothetical protein
MADGQLPGRVAPTQIGQGKSYSEMVADQLGSKRTGSLGPNNFKTSMTLMLLD